MSTVSSDSVPVADWLAETLGALASGCRAAAWDAARRRVQAERKGVEAMLRAPDAGAVYGFNTFLGPLDNLTLLPDQQDRILRAHLVGEATLQDRETARAVLAARISRTAIGSTGCSTEAYDCLLIRWDTGWHDFRADMAASYSSGDVVPGAWFVHSVFGDAGAPRVGDVIALINGDFVSTGLAMRALGELAVFAREIAEAAVSFGAVIDPDGPAVTPSVARVVGAWNLTHRGERAPVQRTVAQRDALIPLSLLLRTWQHLAWALKERLSRPSGNPLFASREGRLEAFSQSSFLGPELSFQLGAASRAAVFAAEYVARVFSLAMERRWREEGDVTAVQPPKAALGKVLGVAARVPALNVFTGAESGGVEDIWDYSLVEARCLLDTLSDLRSIVAAMRRDVATAGRVESRIDEVDVWSAAVDLEGLLG